MSFGAAHTFLFLLIAAAAISLAIRGMGWAGRKKLRRQFENKSGDYDTLLSRYNPYYASLNRTGKDRFLQRLAHFMEVKTFDYIDIDPDERIPLLVGATAIQLTFGLDNYLLDYFQTIHILKDKYRYGLYETAFEGHVSQDGIYLSWSHFVREFNNYADGQNVGLHEMAHALTYVNFTVSEGRDKTFHDHFVEFSDVARPIFERMQNGETNLLDAYAATNYQEFWAVCIETFFERTGAFNKQLPELYSALCSLLNQDPLTPDKILQSDSGETALFPKPPAPSPV
ncbi:MAG TPA: zinc-dependent peptidase [Puia sp.]|jgi:Mlc titration factor MtfA (ptsG expression regulator)|nr:zinc-dependent peptidase [Puia sp.]